MAWLLGIGLMRTVAAREPLAGAHPDTVCRLVLATLDRLWTVPAGGPGRGGGRDGSGDTGGAERGAEAGCSAEPEAG